MKGIKCLFCDEYQIVTSSEKNWFLCLPCGLDFELMIKEKIND
jgi:hypothetical protein